MVQRDDIAVCWVGLGGTKVRIIAEALEFELVVDGQTHSLLVAGAV